MDAGAGEPRQRDVAGDHGLLGRGRHARDPEPAGPCALVHGAVARQAGVLAVLGQDEPEPLGVVEGAAHERAVLDPGAVVGEERDAERSQLAERRQRVTGPADGDSAGDGDLGGGGPAQVEDLADHPGRVDRRLGIGHRHDGRVATERGGAGAGLDRLGLLAPGLAQVRVQVDQAGPDEAAAGVEHGGALRRVDRVVGRDHGVAGDGDVGPGQSFGADDRPAAHDEGDLVLRQRRAPPRNSASRRRGEGTGWPSARQRRSPPAASPPCAAGRPRPRRSRRRAPSGRGA